MRKALVRQGLFGIILVMALSLAAGCGGGQTTNAQMGQAMTTVSQAAASAPQLAKELDDVYAYLVQQKAVPDHLEAATKALAALDAVAPMVQQGADSLKGDNFNWATFVVNAAITAAKVMGYIAPLLV